MAMDADSLLQAKYQLNASLLLSSTSPALAALYASRARASSSQQHNASPPSPMHCPRCSTISVSTRVSSKSRQRTSKTKNAKNTMQNMNVQSQKKKSREEFPIATCRLRIQKYCAVCGYVGAEAVERSGSIPPLPRSREDTREPRRAASPADAEAEECTVHGGANAKGKRKVESLLVLPPGVAESRNLQRSSSAINPSIPVASMPPHGQGSKRQKKKAGLQEVLARSKEQKQSAPAKDAGLEAHGLAAFLSAL